MFMRLLTWGQDRILARSSPISSASKTSASCPTRRRGLAGAITIEQAAPALVGRAFGRRAWVKDRPVVVLCGILSLGTIEVIAGVGRQSKIATTDLADMG